MVADSEHTQKNVSYINKLNRIQVLQLIRESDLISRAEIVKQTKLSAPTVTRIVDSLIDAGLVIMTGEGDSTGGRPPILLKFDGTDNFVIGVDLGSTSIRVALSDLNGTFISEIESITNLEGGFDVIISQSVDLINKLIIRSKKPISKILGIGMAVAGLINVKEGEVEYSPVFNWRNIKLKEEFEKMVDIPFIFDNVSRVTALGELYYGIGSKYKNFICVNLGYGIGAGIIIDGEPFYGGKGFTGEFGHIILERDSKYIGKDGVRGCLEALSSGYGIAEIAKQRIEAGDDTILSQSNLPAHEISAEHVFEAAGQGDQLSIEIIENAFKYLGQGIDLLIKLFNPDAIVLSGGLTRNGDYFFKKVEEYTLENVFSPLKEQVKILPSSFHEDATLIGAFSLIISKVLNFEIDSNGYPIRAKTSSIDLA